MNETTPSIETIGDPFDYTPRQINLMCLIASVLDRGLLVITERPEM